MTLREVELWVYKVPKLPHTYTRRASYIRSWDVIGKIRTAKREGWLHEAIPDDLCDFCGQTLIPNPPAPASIPAMTDELNRLKRRIGVLEFLLAVPAELRAGRRGPVRTSIA